MITKIETLHDLANWVKTTGIEGDINLLIDHLLQGPPDKYKKCQKCSAILPANEMHWDLKPKNGDGLAHFCKGCRRSRNAAYTRKKRQVAKITRNPSDLEEIQRLRQAAGLAPLETSMPKPGRPKES